MVQGSLVFALKSCNKVVQVVGLNLRALAEVYLALRDAQFRHAATNSSTIFVFSWRFTRPLMKYFIFFVAVFVYDIGVGAKFLTSFINFLLKFREG